jgi:4-amino-4-deoxy-L-arabinose transferase-like glycosyltransferase
MLKEDMLTESLAVNGTPIPISQPDSGPTPPKAPGRWVAWVCECLGLVLILTLAGGLRLWRLDQNGWGTDYYTAGVRSMMDSWHNFFYNSFDPGGFVCVDKPPVALWVQVASAKVFGFTPLSILVPQAVMGTLSVLIVYYLVRRRFGAWAAFLAGLALAVTPISIAVDRSNNTDTCLVFVLLLAAWALLRATEKGSLWLLLLSMVLVGVGFNTKMLAAFVVLPTFYLVYFLGSPVSWRHRLGDLALATFVVFGVSLSWAVAYDLTPEDERPYAGSTRNNSMLTLVIEHNGLERFARRGGRGGGPALRNPAAVPNRPRNTPQDDNRPRNTPQDGNQPAPPQFGGFGPPGLQGGPPRPGAGNAPGRGPGGARGGAMFGEAVAGLWRLATPRYVGQVTWLFPLAFIGVFAALFQGRWSWTLSPEHQSLLLWLGWLATYGVTFSFAGGLFHAYYLVMLAPPLAALAGIGLVALWQGYRRGGLRSLFLPLAVLLTAAWQALAWLDYPDLGTWAVPGLLIAAVVSGIGLLSVRGSWVGLGLSAAVLAAVGWLWYRGNEAPDILAAAATQLDEARAWARGFDGFGPFKDFYTKVNPDIGTLIPDLRRRGPLVTPPLLLGTAIAAGCLIGVWLLAKWRPALRRAAFAAVAVAGLSLLLSPGVWALGPVWEPGNRMLPSADVSVLTRRSRELDLTRREVVRGLNLLLSPSAGAATPALGTASVVIASTDLVAFNPRNRGAAGFGRGPGGIPGAAPGAMPGGFGAFPGGFGGGRRLPEQARKEREKLLAFLKANHHGERWVLAVQGTQQAAPIIIETGLPVMAMGGFMGSDPTFGTDPDEIKDRVAHLVEEGKVRFFMVSGFRGPRGGGFGGFGGPNPAGAGQPPAGGRNRARGNQPAGAAAPGGAPGRGPVGFGFGGRGSGVVSQWVQERVEQDKARKVDRRLWSAEDPTQAPAGGRRGGFTRGRPPGMMGGNDIYDLRPSEPLEEPPSE